MSRAGGIFSPLWRVGPPAVIPLTVQAILLGSVALGLVFLLLPAAGYLPALGARRFDFGPLRAAFDHPGLLKAAAITFGSGIVSTGIALLLGLGLAALLDPTGSADRPAGRRLWRVASALIATPHLAVAIGLAFLLSPSGWLLRLLAPCLGFDRPPDYLLVNDPAAVALTLVLVVKETPFVVAVTLTALRRIDVAAQLQACGSLGYAPMAGWIKIVLPQLYRLIRLPVFAVLAYGLSVADLSIVLGPDLPPTLPVLILHLLADPDLANRLVASGAGLIQIGLVVVALLAWMLGERLARRLLHHAITGGRRAAPRGAAILARALLLVAGAASLALGLLAILAMLIWSVADTWRFPDILPDSYSLAAWMRALSGLARPLGESLLLAGAGTAIALAASIACLELEDRIGHAAGRRGQWILYLPLLAPEMGFLFGLQIAAGSIGLTGSFLAVLWFHLLFIFPYVFLTIGEPWRALDDRLVRTARCLGANHWRVLWRIKAPLLKAPLALAAAVGASVSLSLYLPTVLGGAGRVSTLATEAVTLFGGGDRRVLAVYALVQATLSLLAFAVAAAVARQRRFAGPGQPAWP